jgi:hypothetical protein
MPVARASGRIGPVTKVADYRATLRQLNDWEPYLRAESRLPGPRGNLELAEAVSLEGDRDLFARLRDDHGPDVAPENTPECFLAFCGVLGLGADGPAALPELRRWAADPRWRVREAVAMAVQRIADTRPAEAVEAMRDWARGSRLEQRAAVAALCEPRLLRDEATARAALEVLDEVTASLGAPSRDDDERALRKALSYGWSVAVVGRPDPGRDLMERWIADGDAGTRRIMRENLRKARLARLDGEWVQRQLARI